jgi:Zn-dependent peptidase ImmA (M78 family)
MKEQTLIERHASEFRNKYGLSSGEPINLKSLLLKLNVGTLFKPLTYSFSGMAVKLDGNRFILINSTQQVGRQNFTIGHELYHLFIQEDFTAETTYNVGQYNKSDKNEWRADMFASFLLMPQAGISSMIPVEEMQRGKELSLDTIVNLEQYFQVSRAAMLYRLKSLGMIDEPTRKKHSRGVTVSAQRRGFPDTLYVSNGVTEFIGKYGDLANHLVENEKISEGDYYSLMKDIGIDILSNNSGLDEQL